MLKISQIGSDQHSVSLRLEGRMVGPWVGEARAACEKLLAESRILTLELADVSFVDKDGVKFLKDLIPRGVVLVGCSLFVEEQLKSESK